MLQTALHFSHQLLKEVVEPATSSLMQQWKWS